MPWTAADNPTGILTAADREAIFIGLRTRIDALDAEIVRLLNERAVVSLEVGKLKAGQDDAIFRPFREKALLESLVAKNPGPLPPEHLLEIYKEILSSSRQLQRPQKIAYLGPEGTFSYFAGVEYLGNAADFQPRNDFHGVFKAVAERETELGVIPLENSLEGTVGQTLDLFMRFEVFVQAEIYSRISHSLLSKARTLADVAIVYSHPQPLAQCAGWLRANLPHAKLVPVESTAAAARRVEADPDPHAAAICHARLAETLRLDVLAQAIEDQPDNWTRFLIIGPTPAGDGNRDKTSMLFTLPDKPGALAEILTLLARAGVNLKKIESRPLRGEKWKYVFFVDVECDLGKNEYQAVLNDLRAHAHTLRVLGSYPAGPYLGGK